MSFVPELCSVCVAFVLFIVFGLYPGVSLWVLVVVMSFVPELCSVCVAFVPFIVFGSYPGSCLVLVHVCVPSP